MSDAGRTAVAKGIDVALAGMHKLIKLQVSAGERLKAQRVKLSYHTRPEDIIIASYPKSGTTWVQMILLQLLTDGSMDGISHLNTFAPYLEDALRAGWRTRQTGGRIIKTHASYRDVPKGCGHYIYALRDGRDVIVSYFHHHRRNGYVKAFPEFFEQFMKGSVAFGNWFDHVARWRENSRDLSILYVAFEKMTADLEPVVREIAAFCDIPIREADMPRILRNCSFDFMRANEAKLDIRSHWRVQIPPEDDHFIRKGRNGQWVECFDQAMLGAFDARLGRSPGLRYAVREPALARGDLTGGDR